MSNYIDADKLIAEIDNIYSEAVCEYKSTKSRYSEGALDVTHRISSIITSLRQEQPKFKTGDTIHKIGENTVFPMTIERIYDGNYICVTEHQQSFINIKFQDDYELVGQECPGVMLTDNASFTKELKRFLSDTGDEKKRGGVILPIIKHFYELGLNTRKENKT